MLKIVHVYSDRNNTKELMFTCIYNYNYLSIYLSVCLSVCRSICPSICLSVYLPDCLFLSVCLSVCQSVCLSVCLSIYLATYLPSYLPTCLLTYLSITSLGVWQKEGWSDYLKDDLAQSMSTWEVTLRHTNVGLFLATEPIRSPSKVNMSLIYFRTCIASSWFQQFASFSYFTYLFSEVNHTMWYKIKGYIWYSMLS